jgi:hypothetical protein
VRRRVLRGAPRAGPGEGAAGAVRAARAAGRDPAATAARRKAAHVDDSCEVHADVPARHAAVEHAR